MFCDTCTGKRLVMIQWNEVHLNEFITDTHRFGDGWRIWSDESEAGSIKVVQCYSFSFNCNNVEGRSIYFHYLTHSVSVLFDYYFYYYHHPSSKRWTPHDVMNCVNGQAARDRSFGMVQVNFFRFTFSGFGSSLPKNIADTIAAIVATLVALTAMSSVGIVISIMTGLRWFTLHCTQISNGFN